MRKCLLFHRWKIIKSVLLTEYYECEKCGRRKVKDYTNREPSDKNWLNGDNDNA